MSGAYVSSSQHWTLGPGARQGCEVEVLPLALMVGTLPGNWRHLDLMGGGGKQEEGIGENKVT